MLNIASGVANNGLFNWTVLAGITPGNNYFIRITRADLPGSPGLSLAPFTIAAATTAYYINDGTVQPGDWTMAPGDDNNDGLTPLTPKATINGLLTAYPNLGMGKVIMIDAGTYNLTSNIILTAINSGLTFEGFSDPNNPSHTAVLNRGNTNSGSDVFDLTAATGSTLDHLGITGGYLGVNLRTVRTAPG